MRTRAHALWVVPKYRIAIIRSLDERELKVICDTKQARVDMKELAPPPHKKCSEKVGMQSRKILSFYEEKDDISPTVLHLSPSSRSAKSCVDVLPPPLATLATGLIRRNCVNYV